MSQQIINVGSAPNDGLGDPIRTAFIKTNNNFTQLFSSPSPNTIINGSSNVSIPFPASDVLVQVANVSNVAVFSTSGVTINNNIVGNNLHINTIVDPVYTNDLLVTGQIFIDWLDGNANPLPGTGIVASTANIYDIGSNTSAFANAYFNGNVYGGNIFASGIFSAAGVTIGSNISVAGNITGGNLLTSGQVSASGNVIGQNIVTSGIITATGNISGGNLLTSGQVSATSNVSGGNLLTSGSITATGNISGGNLLTSGQVSAGGNVTGQNIITSGIITATGNISGGNLLTSGQVSAGGNVTGQNIITSGIVTASGNVIGQNIITGGQVSAGGNIAVGNITINTNSITSPSPISIGSSSGNTGQVIITGNLQVNGTTTTVDSEIVSTNQLVIYLANNASSGSLANGGGVAVGPVSGPYATLTYSYSANSWISNLPLSVNGNVSGSTFNGSGAGLTNISNANTANSVSGNNLTGSTLSSNITSSSLTSVGTLTSLSVSGNVNASYYIGNGSQLTGLPAGYANSNAASFLASFGSNTISTGGNITAGYFIGNGSQLTGLPAGYANSNAASFLASFGSNTISTSGNITAGYFIGNGSQLTGLPAGYSNATAASFLANFGSNTISTSGTITSGSIFVTGNISASGNVTGQFFNGTATSADYADLAECYTADDEYSPGIVVSFGGDNEITLSRQDGDVTVAGVVSTDPAYLMNTKLKSVYITKLALTGRVPCHVQGTVTKGAMMVSAGNGRARAEANPKIGSVIGKALESFNGEFGTIEIVVGRL